MFGHPLHFRVCVILVPLYFLFHRFVAYLPIVSHDLQCLQLYVRNWVTQVTCQDLPVLTYILVATELQRLLNYHQHLLSNQVARVVFQLLNFRQDLAVAFIRGVSLYDLNDSHSRLISDCLHFVFNEVAEKLDNRLRHLLLLQNDLSQNLYNLAL